jgi:hypothetical protein
LRLRPITCTPGPGRSTQRTMTKRCSVSSVNHRIPGTPRLSNKTALKMRGFLNCLERHTLPNSSITSESPSTNQTARKRSLSELIIIGLVVVGLHIALIAGVLAAFVGRPGNQPGPSRTMVMVFLPDDRQPPKPMRQFLEVKPQLIPPHFEVPPVTPIPVQIETVGSILATSTSASPPFERLITEAEARNPAFLRDYCNHQILSVDGAATAGTVVLMIRVEDDGHISDSKIEESSGNPSVDAATQACITEMGLFQAHLSSGHTIASWQRTHWMWSSGG